MSTVGVAASALRDSAVNQTGRRNTRDPATVDELTQIPCRRSPKSAVRTPRILRSLIRSAIPRDELGIASSPIRLRRIPVGPRVEVRDSKPHDEGHGSGYNEEDLRSGVHTVTAPI